MQCMYAVICNTVRLIIGKVALRVMQFYSIRRMMIDDSTTKILVCLIENSFLKLKFHLTLLSAIFSPANV